MEAGIGGDSSRFYAARAPEFLVKGKGLMPSREWEASDWRWDGDLFVAIPLNGAPAGRQFLPSAGAGEGSSSGSDEGKAEAEKRRRAVADEAEEGGGLLALKLGEQVYPVADGRNCKRTRVGGSSSSSPVVTRAVCQAENCRADLSNAKDYHRRHKVCEVHAKESMVMVGRIMQRFCQQCSRFHVLQEFDEGKRSCRRRLAGHNIRRRKTQPEAVVGGNPLNDDRATSYILMSILRILSNLHAANSSNQSKDQDLLGHLLKNLAGCAGTCDMSVLLGQGPSQALENGGSGLGTSPEKASAAVPASPPCVTAQGHAAPPNSTAGATCSINVQVSDLRASHPHSTDTLFRNDVRSNICTNGTNGGDTLKPAISLEDRCWQPVQENIKRKSEYSDMGKIDLNGFDLNNVYDESEDYVVGSGQGRSPSSVQFEVGLPEYPSWIVQDRNQTSPPQSSIHSDSTTTQSRSSSNGEAQSRTDRIIFKLFDKNPSDLPLAVKGQIYEWLSRSPTDMESYIRPGCIVLTIYLRLKQYMWEEVPSNLNFYLKKLVDASDDPFWRSGWIYARVQNQIAFINNAQVMINTTFPAKYLNRSRIIVISPFAVTASERATFTVKGFNLLQPNTKLFCAYEGRYISQEDASADANETFSGEESMQSLSFSCCLPDVSGRGFIEVEENGLSSCFFPFIVAEQDICSEICMLEDIFEVTDCVDDHTRTVNLKDKTQALEFLHEMGWLLRRNQLTSRADGGISHMETFSSGRIKWLMEFSLNHDWCAVVKKLLDILFDGRVVAEEQDPTMVLSEVCPLHIAVSRKCRPMVELLLRYEPQRISSALESHHDQFDGYNHEKFQFRPDIVGPADVTPLHMAASIEGSETIVDALTNDPGKVALEAWRHARDTEGRTPEDYASQRGFNSYNQLVQKKIDKNSKPAHVAIDIASVLIGPSKSFGKAVVPGDVASGSCRSLEKFSGMHIDNSKKDQYCQLCARQAAYTNTRSTLVYRPVMLSMVAIAAVCVCVALIFKGPPVLFGFPPFRWDLLGYGTI